MALDAEIRIPDTTLQDNDFKDGEILRGSDVNKIVSVLKAGVNENYKDLKESGTLSNEHILDETRHTTTEEKSNWNDKYTKEETVNLINERIQDIGASDMRKAVYDTNDNGIVDDSEKLGGQLPSYYAPNSELNNLKGTVYTKDETYSKNEVNTEVNNTVKVQEITLGTTWVEGSQTVSVQGITENDSPILDVKLSGSIEEMEQQEAEWAKILKVDSTANALVFTAREDTTIQLTVIVKGK